MDFLQNILKTRLNQANRTKHEENLPPGKFAVVIAAGGDATRLMYPEIQEQIRKASTSRVPAFVKQVSLPTMTMFNGQSFIEMTLGSLSALQRKLGVKFPCALITGPNNNQVVCKAVEDFSLARELQVQIIEQNSCPVTSLEEKQILWESGEPFCAPDGTGGCLIAMAHSDWYKTILAEGIIYLVFLYMNDMASISRTELFLQKFIESKQDYLWISDTAGMQRLSILQEIPATSQSNEMVIALEDSAGAYVFQTECIPDVIELIEEHIVYKAAPILEMDGNLIQSVRKEKFLSDIVRNKQKYLALKERHLVSASQKEAFTNLTDQILTSLEKGETMALFQIDIGQKKPGDILAEDFRVEEIKQGAFGLVYICQDEEEEKRVAIKTYSDELRWAYPHQARYFGQEAYHWIMLPNHPNIVRAERVFDVYGRLHIVMEYLEGGNLRELMQMQPISVKDGLQILLDACHGLAFLHEHELIHGDIKPENIMLTNLHRAKLTDLGLSMPIQDGVQIRGGTPGYQAPEHAKGTLSPQISGDIYSLGIVARELLAGQGPFSLSKEREYPLSDLKLVVERALSQIPADRPSLEDLILVFQSAYSSLSGNVYAPADIPLEEDETQRFLNLANSLIAMGKPNTALSVCDEWARTIPGSMEKYTRALALYDLQKVRECYTVCLEIQQDDSFGKNFGERIKGLMDLCEVRLGRSKTPAIHFQALAVLALQMHRNGRLALNYIDVALYLDPLLHSAWAFKGECLYDLGLFEESLMCYQKALHAEEIMDIASKGLERSKAILSGKGGKDFQVSTNNDQGDSAYQASDYHSAEKHFLTSLTLAPDNSHAWLGLGLTKLYIGEMDQAVENLQKSIHFASGDANSLYNLGFALLMKGEYRDAQQAFENTLQLDPDYIQALQNKGVSLLLQGKLTEAKKVFEEVLLVDPGRFTASEALRQIEAGLQQDQLSIPEEFWQNQCVELIEKGLFREALNCARNGIKINADNATNWYNAGYILWELGQHHAAIEHCQQALDRNPSLAHAWNILGNAFDNLGEIDRALEAYEQAIKVDDQYHEAWNGRGLILKARGHYQEALESFEKAIRLAEKYGRGWYNKGMLLFDMGRHDESIECFEAALNINANYLGAAQAMGVVYLKLHQYDAAINSLKKAIVTNPVDADAWCALGAAQLKQGDTANALISTQKALEVNPEHRSALSNLKSIQRVMR